MSRWVRSAVALILAGVVGGLAWATWAAQARRRALAHRVATLPTFAARAVDGASLPPLGRLAGPVLLVYFAPDCDHCQREAAEFRQHAAALARTNVVWLSTDSLPSLRLFARQQGLSELPTVRVAQITPAVAMQTLGFVAAPSALAYSGQKTLVRRYRGETSVAALLQGLH